MQTKKKIWINEAFCDVQHDTVVRNLQTINKIATVDFNVLGQLCNSTSCISKKYFKKEK